MMRNPTEEEIRLIEELQNPDLSEAERNRKRKRLIEIDEEETKDWPFCH